MCAVVVVVVVAAAVVVMAVVAVVMMVMVVVLLSRQLICFLDKRLIASDTLQNSHNIPAPFPKTGYATERIPYLRSSVYRNRTFKSYSLSVLRKICEKFE